MKTNRKFSGMIKSLISAFVVILAGCSTMQTYYTPEVVQEVKSIQNYQIMVQTGNESMDKLVYEFAYQELANILPIEKKGQPMGSIEITFASSSDSSFVGSTAAFTTTTGYGNGWYTGSGYTGANVTTSSTGTGITSGGTFTWQNSTMIVVIKNIEGKRLWSADYGYKGGWEMSGWSVNTPQEAARLCIKRIVQKMKKDFLTK
ncbi:MAG: hypothetical protein KJ935_03180 [Candidatus Omnitrophica bacterium]|nr:hypothetical protein [Candidatus Omnitrophota bacterium]